VSQQGLIFLVLKKLDECSVIMDDDRPCHMEGIGTVLVKMFDGMVWELKNVRYVPQLKRNLISIGALKVLGHEASIRNEFLKMVKGLMAILTDAITFTI